MYIIFLRSPKATQSTRAVHACSSHCDGFLPICPHQCSVPLSLSQRTVAADGVVAHANRRLNSLISRDHDRGQWRVAAAASAFTWSSAAWKKYSSAAGCARAAAACPPRLPRIAGAAGAAEAVARARDGGHGGSGDAWRAGRREGRAGPQAGLHERGAGAAGCAAAEGATARRLSSMTTCGGGRTCGGLGAVPVCGGRGGDRAGRFD